ncbi:hypothetical protein [Oceanobacillus indicireducens]|uniref:Uncharacterized protein n=1 Tax=Oceanobacillus indicireducens TaxID=1004261 RepID=A0A918D1J2_9BACI|nr:hypothetical protein [Oceanobacillus indicireducens]GGN57537.1 hypothetical protein GCM10007971_18560 [Oceanobacillus indicireducens]
MNNSLFEELKIVQNDYLSLLKELNKIPQDEISLDKIDSINVFWYENRNIVNLVFDYLFKGKDTYCFSAATIFDVDNKDQNSFFLLGNYHVFDDPIPSYLNTIIGISDKIYLEKMKKIISNTIKDNIRIIEELNSDLIIFPLRYTSVILNQHYEQLDEIAEKLFCNLFNDIENITEYRTKVVTLEDLIKHLDYHNSSVILLFEGDDPSNTWEYRMERYKENNDNYDMNKHSIGSIFFFAVYGHLRQALALFDMESTFEVIPFIRSFIPLHYYILLSSIFEKNLKPELEHNSANNKYWKSQVSYFLYQEFRKREIDHSLWELKQKAIDIDFETKLFNELGYSANEQEAKTIKYVVSKLLDEIEKN